MSKTKWYSKVFYLAIALALAVSLAGMAAVSAAPAEESEWDDVSTPNMEDFVIAPESDIYGFDMGPDGETIYAVGVGLDEDGTGDVEARLWKSEDGGVTWEDLAEDELPDDFDPTTDILYLVAVSPDQTEEDEDFVVVAGAYADGTPFVYISGESGEDFCPSSFFSETGCTDDILCLDVSSERDDEFNIAVGTAGGEVWRLELGCAWCPAAWELAGGYDAGEAVYPGWDNSDEDGAGAEFTTVAVTSVAFSPNFDADDTVLAVTTDDDDTYLQTGLWGATEAWNEETETFPEAIEIVDEAPDYGAFDECWATGIALPEDYTGYDDDMLYSWVYVNYDGEGHVFEIDGFDAEPADVDCGPNDLADDDYPMLASIAMTGEIDDGALMVGACSAEEECCDGVQVYRTGEWPIDVCCPDWQRADKPPTGVFSCIVAYTPDGKKAYAATMGDGRSVYDESAFSMSEIEEVGKYWNQLSLIDTWINYLSDVAVNPECGTIYLASVNTEEDGCGCDSVWASTDEGDSYMRIWCGALEGNAWGENGLIRLNPEEEEEVLNVYLIDQGTNVVYWNEDGGLTKWNRRTASTLDEIVDFAVLDESTVYALDINGDVAKSDHNASRWLSAEESEVDDGHTIAVLGDYVLVGGVDQVSYSDDEGESFTELDDDPAGNVHVAFDSYFEDNGVVYAAADSIYMCEDLEEEEWDEIEEDAADYGPYYGIVLDNADGNPMTDEDTGGVLYAVYDSGMARLLAAADNDEFDYLVNGAPGADAFIAEPSALRICGCLTEDSNSLLWAINMLAYDLEDADDNLFVYEDCLSKAGVDLSKVKDGATIPSDPCICVNEEFILEWDELCNSSTYDLTIALDKDFDYPIIGMLSGDDYDELPVDDESILIPQGDLDCNDTYYWRVRVIMADDDDETIRSWWSDTWSFSVEAGPVGAIQLTAPEDGATDVAIEGVVFTWTSVAEATSYDLVVNDADGFIVDSVTIEAPGTSYAYSGTLNYWSNFTWKVTAMKDGSVLSASSVSTFRTEAASVWTCPQCGLTFPSQEALQAHIADAHPAPAPPVTPAWVWVIIGIGAVLVIVVIVLIFRTRRV